MLRDGLHQLVLVTGASGFVGRELCRRLLDKERSVRAAVRNPMSIDPKFCREIDVAEIGEIGRETNWRAALKGVNVVVHLAARVHVMHERATNPLEAFRLVNVAGTERLARAALDAGVKRVIYVSSIKVNGEGTGYSTAFSESDVPAPRDPYGVSKCEAEQALLSIARNTDLEVVIVRPPLIYGPGVGGNFIRLLNWVARGVPLPLSTVRNRRSLVYLGNLVDALIVCTTHVKARGETFLISDGDDVSTAELVQRIAAAMGTQSHLFPMPEAALRVLGLLTGKSAEVSRLVDSLVVNSSKVRTELEWRPPYSLNEGLQATVDWYRQHRNTKK